MRAIDMRERMRVDMRLAMRLGGCLTARPWVRQSPVGAVGYVRHVRGGGVAGLSSEPAGGGEDFAHHLVMDLVVASDGAWSRAGGMVGQDGGHHLGMFLFR